MEDELRQAAYYEAKYDLVIKDIIARENFSVTRRELEEEAAAIAERQHSTIEMVIPFLRRGSCHAGKRPEAPKSRTMDI